MTQKNLFRNKGRKKIVDNKKKQKKNKACFIIIFFTTFLHDKDTAIFSRFDEEQTLHIFYQRFIM